MDGDGEWRVVNHRCDRWTREWDTGGMDGDLARITRRFSMMMGMDTSNIHQTEVEKTMEIAGTKYLVQSNEQETSESRLTVRQCELGGINKIVSIQLGKVHCIAPLVCGSLRNVWDPSSTSVLYHLSTSPRSIVSLEIVSDLLVPFLLKEGPTTTLNYWRKGSKKGLMRRFVSARD